MEIHEDLRVRLENSQKQRQVEIQKRKESRETEGSNQKLKAVYLEEFGKKQAEIEELLSKLSLGVIDTASLPDVINDTSKEISLLQKYYTASTLFLNQHEARRSQEAIQGLLQRFQELEGKLLPRKKFGFKVRKTMIDKNLTKENSLANDKDTVDGDGLKKFLNYSQNEFGVKDRNGETVVMHANSVSKQDVSLSKLTDCKVKIFGSPSTLHITGLANCTVLCGPVATSVFINECNGCKFVVPCQQLRIHQSQTCDLYLYVTSRAIIEDCTAIRFAPYNWRYDEIDTHFKEIGWDINDNNWHCIDDFNWLASDKPSPNWYFIPEKDRLSCWDC